MATKKGVTRKKCPSCNKLTGTDHKFCQHCGHNLVPPKNRGVHKCPSCKGILEGHSRYCKHCGASVDTYAHHTFVRLLLFFIVFLVVAFALLIFFSPTLVNYSSYDQDVVLESNDPFLRMSNAVCTWKDGSFNLCTNVNWDGNSGDYSKCSFSGNMDEKTWTSSPFTCCGTVGDTEGIKLARSFLFDDEGNIYDDEGVSVSCLGKPSKITVSASPSSKDYAKSYWFTAKTRSTSGTGNGVEVINFPDKVKSCEYTGRWITTKDLNSAGYCVGAQGVFNGYADLFEQEVYSNPGKFNWEGLSKNLIDPEGELYDNIGIYTPICSNEFSITPKHYVTGKINGFETNKLTLDWEYYSNYPRPAVDIFMDFKCKVY